jgi:hypothetical protein
MHTIGEPTILSNTHEVPMYAKNDKELEEKDIKESLVFRKDIELND